MFPPLLHVHSFMYHWRYIAASTDRLVKWHNEKTRPRTAILIVSLPFLLRFPAPNSDKSNPEIRHVDVISLFLKAMELAGFCCLLVTT
jgi:hypothetical protein